MTTVNIYRKPAPQFANDKVSNIHVGDILETPGDDWSTISEKITHVADRVDDFDYGPSTTLGNKEGFMSPFKEVLELYKKQYSSYNWCITIPEDDVIGETDDPFDSKPSRLDTSFAQKMNLPLGSDVIIIGDIHSGIHSFVEIIDSLVSRKIMNESLKLTSGYYLVFLGDIVDRGGYGLDILHVIFRLKVANPTGVFVINGNHEDVGTYSRFGFKDELESQLKDPDDQILVHDLLTYLPTVLFLHVNNDWLQLNHGGIEPNYNPGAFIESEYDMEFHGYDTLHNLSNMGLRWNDFNGNVEFTKNSTNRGANNSIKEYGKTATDHYLESNGLSGIIRGHQDTMHFAAMKKTHGDNRFMYLIKGVGMFSPGTDYWKEEEDNGWHHISISDTFRDFSVVTTSTAVRARNLGYHTYLQISSSEIEASVMKKLINDNYEVISDFVESLGLSEEFIHVMEGRPGSSFSSPNKEKWDYAMNHLRIRGISSFPLFVLSSYNPIVDLDLKK